MSLCEYNPSVIKRGSSKPDSIVLEAGICLSHTIWRIRQRGTGWSTKNAPQNLSGVMAATGKEEWPTQFKLPEGNNKYGEV
jgi:hypothetical protein